MFAAFLYTSNCAGDEIGYKTAAFDLPPGAAAVQLVELNRQVLRAAEACSAYSGMLVGMPTAHQGLHRLGEQFKCWQPGSIWR